MKTERLDNKQDRQKFIESLKRMFPVTQISTFVDTNDELIRVPQSRRVMFLNSYNKDRDLYDLYDICVNRRHGRLWIHIKCLEQETPVVKRPNFSEMLKKLRK